MNLQTSFVVLLIFAAIAYLSVIVRRNWSAQAGKCGGGCGCATQTEARAGLMELTIRETVPRGEQLPTERSA